MITTYDDAWLIDGRRSGFGAVNGTISNISATDLGIAVVKGLLSEAKINPQDIDCLFAANLAPSDFDAGYLPRHIGLYSGLPQGAPALMLQRLCGSGFELIAAAADYRQLNKAEVMLCVGSESMSRMPVASLLAAAALNWVKSTSATTCLSCSMTPLPISQWVSQPRISPSSTI